MTGHDMQVRPEEQSQPGRDEPGPPERRRQPHTIDGPLGWDY
jgi:hypothetical protein